jgi:4-amino-4-deoxy-L-arabinose transferase-like glycosyltransferase
MMVLQSTTTQNDLLVMLYCGIVLAGILYFREYKETRYLLLSVTAGSIALGVKISAALVFPALLFIALVWVGSYLNLKHVLQTIAGALVAISLFVLPAGLISNLFYYGHPLGSESWRAQHSFVDISLVDRTEATVINSLRYISDFVSLGGFSNRRRFPSQWLEEAKAGAGHLLTEAGLHLESKQHTRRPFTYRAVNRSDSESLAYLGEIGWLLLLPLVGIVLFHRKHSNEHDARDVFQKSYLSQPY